MKKLRLLILLIAILIGNIQLGLTQVHDNTQTNPIIFADVSVGLTFGDATGLGFGASLNYQTGRNLFTFSYNYNYIADFDGETALITPFTPIPILVIKDDSNQNTLALLYGWRFEEGGHAWNVSLGPSYHHSNDSFQISPGLFSGSSSSYIGASAEIGIKWFKAEKRPYHLFGVVPVGPPTSFGRSLGFKLVGNISENSYIGLLFTYGLGYHKKY